MRGSVTLDGVRSFALVRQWQAVKLRKKTSVLAPTLPWNETERLAQLYDYAILDTAPECVFDEIVEIAASVCATPVAAITLLDRDRQWLKAAQGVGALTQTERAVSICGHAILQPGHFEVPDTELDPRFANNPFLTKAGLQFYGGYPLVGKKGAVLGMLCVLDHRPRSLTPAQRLTLRQLAGVVVALMDARRVERQRQWLSALVDNLQDEVLVFDADSQRCLHASGAALRRLGGPGALPGQISVMDVAPSLASLELSACMRQLQDGAHEVIHETVGLNAQGKEFPAEVRWRRIEAGGHLAIMAVVRDISERKQLDQAQDEFISVMSHEMRTPLTSVFGAISLVESGVCGELPTRATQMVKLAFTNIQSLLHIVNNILDLEGIMAGKMVFNLQPLDCAAVLQRLALSHQHHADAKRLSLEVDAPAGLNVLADRQRLEQILGNLISNAIKFSPPDAKVWLRAHEHEPDEDEGEDEGGCVRFGVTDHGAGIPEQFRRKIFSRFAQADMQATRAQGGSGLGLWIVKSMAEKMNGLVGFDSRPGLTTMYVQLPAAWLSGLACEQPDAQPGPVTAQG